MSPISVLQIRRPRDEEDSLPSPRVLPRRVFPPKARTSPIPLVTANSPISVPSESKIPKSAARVTYDKNLRRITLQRYLCSKIVFDWENTPFTFVLVLYDNLLMLQDVAQRDKGFQRKYGKDLKILSILLKETRFSEQRFPGQIRKLSSRIRAELGEFYIPHRNLLGVEIHVKGRFHIRDSRSPGVEIRNLPPKAYIGKGYNDKGHKRDKAYDGSPSWQDVAMRGKL